MADSIEAYALVSNVGVTEILYDIVSPFLESPEAGTLVFVVVGFFANRRKLCYNGRMLKQSKTQLVWFVAIYGAILVARFALPEFYGGSVRPVLNPLFRALLLDF